MPWSFIVLKTHQWAALLYWKTCCSIKHTSCCSKHSLCGLNAESSCLLQFEWQLLQTVASSFQKWLRPLSSLYRWSDKFVCLQQELKTCETHLGLWCERVICSWGKHAGTSALCLKPFFFLFLSTNATELGCYWLQLKSVQVYSNHRREDASTYCQLLVCFRFVSRCSEAVFFLYIYWAVVNQQHNLKSTVTNILHCKTKVLFMRFKLSTDEVESCCWFVVSWYWTDSVSRESILYVALLKYDL